MKNIVVFITSWLLAVSTNAQEIKMVETSSLNQIANEFGIDSALTLSHGLPIYKIDSLTAIQLLQHVAMYNFPNRTSHFFEQMAHSWKVEPIRKKTYDFTMDKLASLQAYDTSITAIYTIDERLLVAAIIQRPDSLEKELLKCYSYTNELAKSYKKLFPSPLKRFFDYFTIGDNQPAIRAYKTCHKNCALLMLTLKKMESEHYSASKLRYHNSKLRRWERKREKGLMEYYQPYKEYESQQYILSKSYMSLSEIDYQNEPELAKILQEFSHEKCRRFMLFHGTTGFLDLGCLFAPLAGHGVTYKVELKENNRLILTLVSGWIS